MSTPFSAEVYSKEMTMCALARDMDPKTWRKWTCLFETAISDLLKPLVGSFPIL